MNHTLRTFLALTLFLAAGPVLLSAADVQAAGATNHSALARQIADGIYECLDCASSKEKSGGKLYYDGGIWRSPNQEKTWDAHTSPGSAAAALWSSGLFNDNPAKKEQLFRWAVDTFDRAIKSYRQPNGYIGVTPAPSCMFFLVELGSAYIDLEPALDQEHKTLWKDVLVKGINAMMERGDLLNLSTGRNWYTNGNIELDEALMLYYAFNATGDAKFKDMFERQFAFTLAPGQEKWKEFGLQVTRKPAREDGSDGKAYLSEGGGKEAGFDPDYSMFQASIAARLFLATADARVLRLTNLLLNQVLTKVDRSTWILDATGGTRRNNKQPFTSAALLVATFQGGRKEFQQDLPAFVKLALEKQKGGCVQGWLAPGMYRGFSTSLIPMMRSAMHPGSGSP